MTIIEPSMNQTPPVSSAYELKAEMHELKNDLHQIKDDMNQIKLEMHQFKAEINELLQFKDAIEQKALNEIMLKRLGDYIWTFEQPFYAQLKNNPMVLVDGRQLKHKYEFTSELTEEFEDVVDDWGYSDPAIQQVLTEKPCHGALVAYYRSHFGPDSDSCFKFVNIKYKYNDMARSDLPTEKKDILARIPQDITDAQRVSVPRIKDALIELLPIVKAQLQHELSSSSN